GVDMRYPGTGAIDKGARGDRLAAACSLHSQFPAIGVTDGADAARARADRSAAFCGIDGIEDDEPCVVHLAVGIFEAAGIDRTQRQPERVVREIEAAACGKQLAAPDM